VTRAAAPRPPTVVLYSRPDCHLCDDARALLERVRTDLPFVLRERDIDADDDLLRRYLERIPVVEIDGREAFELFVDEAALRRALAEAAARPRERAGEPSLE
jgi:glutaredoxin